MYHNYSLEDYLIKIAEKSCVNQKHSAAIIKNGEVINIGYNKYCSSFAKKSTIHAEMDVLMNLKKKYKKHLLTNIDIVIIRISSKGSILKNSRPCNQCLNILKKFNIRRVYYSNDFGEIVYEKTIDMESGHVCAGERFHKKNKQN